MAAARRAVRCRAPGALNLDTDISGPSRRDLPDRPASCHSRPRSPRSSPGLLSPSASQPRLLPPVSQRLAQNTVPHPHPAMLEHPLTLAASPAAPSRATRRQISLLRPANLHILQNACRFAANTSPARCSAPLSQRCPLAQGDLPPSGARLQPQHIACLPLLVSHSFVHGRDFSGALPSPPSNRVRAR